MSTEQNLRKNVDPSLKPKADLCVCHHGQFPQLYAIHFPIFLPQWSVDVPLLPLGALEEIFHNIPAEQLVCTCRLVCQEWKEAVDSACLWKERCRREGLHPCDPDKIPSDWRLFYFLCKKRRNLLKNPKAEGKESLLMAV